MDNFVQIHLHDDYSVNMDGFSKVVDVVKRIGELGQPAFAVTNHGTLTGLMDSWKEVTKYNKKHGTNIKLIFGCEFYFVDDVTIKDREYYHLIILAKNETGYRNLLKLDSLAHQNKYYKPRIDWNILSKYSEGLIVTSACMGGILKHSNPDMLARKFKEHFGDDFYIELHTNTMPEQTEFNKRAVNIAQKLGIQVVAACDSHYVYREDADTHRKWVGISDGDESDYYTTDDYYIHSGSEAREKLSYIPENVVDEAIKNTVVIANKCTFEPIKQKNNYPRLAVKDPAKEVRKKCEKAWKKKVEKYVPEDEWPVYQKRLEKELDILTRAGYNSYFLIKNLILTEALKRKIPIGVGRGSVGGSLVAWLMDITKLNPLKYDLLFERFSHLERISPPDIDTDVSRKRRNEIIQFIKDEFGEVYQCRTINYMKAKGALKRAGQALKLSPEYVNELSKSITFEDDEDDEDNKDKLHKDIHALDGIRNNENAELIDLAKKFVGHIQSYGVHASAVVVFPGDPNEFCAIEVQGENPVTSYPFGYLEDIYGLLKLDILGLKTLDVIADTLETCGAKLDLEHLPEVDKVTFDMLCRGETQGVFQIEGHGMTKLVRDISPQRFFDLIDLVALFRPGTLQAGMDKVYVSRRQGLEPIEYPHPSLEPILKPTYGIILYQEQIMQIAQVLCGYSLGEADMLRRAVGKKKPEEMEKIKPEFIKRGIEQGYDPKLVEDIFQLIEYFASYGFNKSHSVSYGYTAYITAYLKAHFPTAYMVSLINSESKQEDIKPYLEECKRMNIKLLSPDINKSSEKWSIEGNAIRMGLTHIKNVSKITFSGGPFKDFEDFIRKNPKTNRKVIISLIKAGAFGNEDRGLLLAKVDYFKETLARVEECKTKIQENSRKLSEAETDKDKRKYQRQLDNWKKKLNEIPNADSIDRLRYDPAAGEQEVLGYSFIDILDSYDLGSCVPFENTTRRKLIGGEITKFYTHIIKKGNNAGKEMAFISIRTKEENNIDLVMFPNYYKKLSMGHVYIFEVREDKVFGTMEGKKIV